jgi:hypothetical protein
MERKGWMERNGRGIWRAKDGEAVRGSILSGTSWLSVLNYCSRLTVLPLYQYSVLRIIKDAATAYGSERKSKLV